MSFLCELILELLILEVSLLFMIFGLENMVISSKKIVTRHELNQMVK